MKRHLVVAATLIALLFAAGCSKEKRYIYQVQEQELYQSAAQKQYLKTTDQFISIAYTHLYGVSITNNQLNQYNLALMALGDKATIQDMIVKSLINKAGVQIPGDAAMRADVTGFVAQTYLRLLNRKPNEFEAWKMKDLIEKNADITPKMIYYAMMTSNEYRYY
ncbi:MAG TPA: hypothetical protein PLW44_01630 [Chitinophagales bacterium]|nr:hypothetical protein [Chitinophagales bacterium]